ncbi:uncharacterized protein DSM5745_08473 [Aspergillus mulundensis]|uniref:Zn(2)-C6 fungal-type domain-containing protein n=1 Tax=Aspergillus mulundensis TaxID=1810919 RepID=A0A3D8R3S9_9EURO|nr:hypothetical protein DSM5745_08473 [Aspergillus mulundensis]RDW68713.1 hypothetical protein DSM5745_08473 [Aspergillus mulundensis]
MPRRLITPGRSCLECRRRKIKCDRSHPCAYCVKVRINCKYPASRRDIDDEPYARDFTALKSKVLALEKRLAELGEPVQSDSTEHGPASTPSTQSQVSPQTHAGITSSHPSAGRTGPMTLVKARGPINLNVYRPPPQTMAVLWQIYLDVVDPVLKLFHVPSVQKLITQTIRGRDKVEPALECLLFAIYYAAVAAITPSVCKEELDEGRAALLKRYRTVIENLLSRLDLLHSTDMIVLQSLALYLITARNDPDGPDVYSLTGLATGMALKMGLNQDPEAQGFTPFDCEIRRRLWWQIFTLDTRVAEERGSEPCIMESAVNTRLPSNIADANLHPAMTRLQGAKEGRTEMLFSLVRFEGSYFARQMVFSAKFARENEYTALSSEQKAQAIECFQSRIQKQYLVHCDEGIPLDRVIARSIRLILDKLKLTVLEQTSAKETLSRKERVQRQQAWMGILKDAEELRSHKDAQWLWLFQVYIEWDALVHLLRHLRAHADSTGNCDNEAWELANRVYSHWQGSKFVRRDYRWREIEELWLQLVERRKQISLSRRRNAAAYQLTSMGRSDAHQTSGLALSLFEALDKAITPTLLQSHHKYLELPSTIPTQCLFPANLQFSILTLITLLEPSIKSSTMSPYNKKPTATESKDSPHSSTTPLLFEQQRKPVEKPKDEKKPVKNTNDEKKLAETETPKWYTRLLEKLPCNEPEDYTLYIGLPTAEFKMKDRVYGGHTVILQGKKSKACQWWYGTGRSITPEENSSPTHESHPTKNREKRCKLHEVVEVGVLKAEHYVKFAAIMAKLDKGVRSGPLVYWALETARKEELLRWKDVELAFCVLGLSSAYPLP